MTKCNLLGLRNTSLSTQNNEICPGTKQIGFHQIHQDNVQTATSMGCIFLTVSGTFWRQFWFLCCKEFSHVLTHLEGFSAWDIRKHRNYCP